MVAAAMLALSGATAFAATAARARHDMRDDGQHGGLDDKAPRAMPERGAPIATPAISTTMIVGSIVPGSAAAATASGTIGSPPVQVNGSAPDSTGYLAFKYGADAKGTTNFWVKTRGSTMNSYAAVQTGDRIVLDLWQAGTGNQTGHAGGTIVTVDGAAFTAGEVPGRWTLTTGTGIQFGQATPQYPTRYGSLGALVANSYQQVLFPGGAAPVVPGAGANFGGWVVIGAGAPSPGFGALKFLSSGAALLTAPEAGAFEVDAAARPYFTTADGVRRAVVLADPAIPTIVVLAGAGPGASATVDANGASGIVTLTTGEKQPTGSLFTVTYAHPYAATSYPVISAANAAAAVIVKGGYLTATATGFTVSVPTGLTVETSMTYAITFYAPGR